MVGLQHSEYDATFDDTVCTVNMTIDSQVTLCKLYGPLCFDDIRVTLDYDKCQWVIEKHVCVSAEDDDDVFEWQEVSRIDGQ